MHSTATFGLTQRDQLEDLVVDGNIILIQIITMCERCELSSSGPE